MDKNNLLNIAKRLKTVSNNTYKEYQLKEEELVNKINKMMLERKDLEHLIGKDNTSMMKDNHANHARFMASILKHYDPDVLVDTVLWVFRAYRSHGFATNYWAAQLNAWIVILKEMLSTESYNEIYPFYELMQISIPVFVILSDEKLDASKSLH